jgi:hypothetical protein
MAEGVADGPGTGREALIFFGLWPEKQRHSFFVFVYFTLCHADSLRLCVVAWGAEMRIKWEVENLSKGSRKNRKVPYVQFSPEIGCRHGQFPQRFSG